jgi:hypothetical protein
MLLVVTAVGIKHFIMRHKIDHIISSLTHLLLIIVAVLNNHINFIVVPALLCERS